MKENAPLTSGNSLISIHLIKSSSAGDRSDLLPKELQNKTIKLNKQT